MGMSRPAQFRRLGDYMTSWYLLHRNVQTSYNTRSAQVCNRWADWGLYLGSVDLETGEIQCIICWYAWAKGTCIHKQRPGWPDTGVWPRRHLPQSLGNKSNTAWAIPKGMENIRASKSTPGHPQPTRRCHTTLITPPKPPISFKTLNIAPFGLASPQDLASTPLDISNQVYCAQDVFPMQAMSADPQQSDACRSRTGRSEIGVQWKEISLWLVLWSFQHTDHLLSSIKTCTFVASSEEYDSQFVSPFRARVFIHFSTFPTFWCFLTCFSHSRLAPSETTKVSDSGSSTITYSRFQNHSNFQNLFHKHIYASQPSKNLRSGNGHCT